NEMARSSRPRRSRPLQFLQPPRRLVESSVGLREAEPHLLAARIRVAIEAAARHDRHADFLDQVTREVAVARKTEARNVRHHVVSAARLEAAESGAFEGPEHPLPPQGVGGAQLLIVTLRQPQRRGPSLL